VKEEGHADSYENLSINYIRGHNPDLVLFDDENNEMERHPLNAMKTDEIHEFVKSKGFVRLSEEVLSARRAAKEAEENGSTEF
jgi:hypothetical protein